MVQDPLISGERSSLFSLGSEDVRSLIEEFLVICKTDRECSARTLGDYREKLSLFVRYLQESGSSLDIHQIGQAQIRAFKAYLQGEKRWHGKRRSSKPLSDSSRAAYHRVLRTFFHWLEFEDYIEV